MYISFTYGINIVQFSDTLCFHKRVKCCMNINSFMLKEGCFAFLCDLYVSEKKED